MNKLQWGRQCRPNCNNVDYSRNSHFRNTGTTWRAL